MLQITIHKVIKSFLCQFRKRIPNASMFFDLANADTNTVILASWTETLASPLPYKERPCILCTVFDVS